MQFYLNGYKPGDPFIEDPHPSVAERPGGLPEDADVLIIGCGPAGLVLAAQMANFPDIRTVVIDRNSGHGRPPVVYLFKAYMCFCATSTPRRPFRTSLLPRALNQLPHQAVDVADEYIAGAQVLRKKIARYKPEIVALVGVTVFRGLFALKPNIRVTLGLQQQRIGSSRVFVLPNPSGLNAHFVPKKLSKIFRELKEESDLA